MYKYMHACMHAMEHILLIIMIEFFWLCSQYLTQQTNEGKRRGSSYFDHVISYVK